MYNLQNGHLGVFSRSGSAKYDFERIHVIYMGNAR
jgi:hypothetical protein